MKSALEQIVKTWIETILESLPGLTRARLSEAPQPKRHLTATLQCVSAQDEIISFNELPWTSPRLQPHKLHLLMIVHTSFCLVCNSMDRCAASNPALNLPLSSSISA